MLFCDLKNVRLRRQHQQQNQQHNQQQAQQQNQQPKQQQNLIEFGLPAQIYGVGFWILMVFGRKSLSSGLATGHWGKASYRPLDTGVRRGQPDKRVKHWVHV